VGGGGGGGGGGGVGGGPGGGGGGCGSGKKASKSQNLVKSMNQHKARGYALGCVCVGKMIGGKKRSLEKRV